MGMRGGLYASAKALRTQTQENKGVCLSVRGPRESGLPPCLPVRAIGFMTEQSWGAGSDVIFVLECDCALTDSPLSAQSSLVCGINLDPMAVETIPAGYCTSAGKKKTTCQKTPKSQ